MTLTITRVGIVGAGSLLGVDDPTPIVQWALTSNVDGDQPTAYQVSVGTTPGGSDVVATAKVLGDAQQYEIRALLHSATRYYVRVRTWGIDDVASDWEAMEFETGLWALADWQGAKWIGKAGETAAPQLRKDFTTTSTPTRARLYYAAGAYAEIAVNGQRVTEPLSPGFTNYSKRVQYVTVDVTEEIVASGANTIGATLGRGFFGCTTITDWNWHTAPWAGNPRLLALLVITYADGEQTVVTDASWKVTAGPTLADSIYLGEVYDSRNETPGWESPGFNDSTWVAASVMSAPAGALTAQTQEPIRAGAPIAPTAVTSPPNGATRYTFPKVMTGWCRMTVTAPAGTTITLTYSEKTWGDGLFTINDHVQGDCQVDRFIADGTEQVWEPRFSYKGFRFVDVVGAVPTSLEAIPVWTDYAERGQWTSSNALLNQLHAMAAQSFHINSHGIVTDTPTYERNGWLGDGNVMADSALYMWDSVALLKKWCQDMDDDFNSADRIHVVIPSGGTGYVDDPGWTSAYVLITHRLWKLTGDLSIVTRCFERMRRYVDRFLVQSSNVFTSFTTYGDWSSPAGNNNDGERDMVSAICVARQTRALADMCDAVGQSGLAESYRDRASAITAAANARLRQPDGTYKPGVSWTGAVQQTPMVLALADGLTAGTSAEVTAAALESNVRVTKGNHTSCGIIGAPDLLPVLTEYGYVDTAYAVATQTTTPSWGQWAAAGATTTWNGFGAAWEVRSLSHHMHGSYAAWFYRYLAGINIVDHKTVVIDPHVPTGLDTVTATVNTPRGPVSTDRSGDELTVTIPPGITATYQGATLPSGTTTISL